MREAEGRLIPRMLELAIQRWRQRGIDEAYATFFSDAPLPDDILTHPEHESLFLTWVALQFAPALYTRWRRSPPPATPAELLLAEARDLSEVDRRFVVAANRRRCHFYVVKGAEPGESIDLEDALTGSACRVVERTASKTVRAGGMLYARVVSLDGESIMLGCGAALLKPTTRTQLADAIRDATGRRGRLTDREVDELDDQLRRWYLFAAEHELNPPLPTVTNTDGDPLAPTTMHFALTCTPEDAYAALRSLNISDADDSELLDGAERDGSGRLQGFLLDWTKRGNRQHKDWENTILGHIEVRDSALTASVNSNRRAERLRKEIEKRLGSRVAFVRSVIESIETLMRESREKAGRGGTRQGDRQPETEPGIDPAVVDAFYQRHWDNWLDERIPALKNRTPREAARTPAGRQRLEALLREFEWQGGAPVERLRNELGL